MTTDLKYLAFTAMLTAALWIPYVVCQVMTNGFLAPVNYVDPSSRPVPLWGKRADRAYLNAVEVFAPFAALVVVANIDGKSRRDDGILGDVLFLAAAGARRRLPAGDSLCADADLHPGLRRGRGDFLGADQVASARADERRQKRRLNPPYRRPWHRPPA
jgi:uncharacterized MAPEG superfamily protein